MADQIGSGSDDRFDFEVSEVDGFQTDGFALAVVYSNPSEQLRTIVFLDGGTDSAGDSFTLGFSEPVDTTEPGFEALLSLGIGFGLQNDAEATGQFSQIDVNGRRLTTSAGGQDDGSNFDGGLITIGGLDDDPANLVDPLVEPGGPRTDDELYNLALGDGVSADPFLPNGATSVVVETLNPSDNDNIFFAGFNITDVVAVDTEETDPPVTVDDTDATTADVAIALIDVLSNDFDPDGDTITVTTFDDTGTAGVVTDNGDGTFSYDPNGAFDSLAAGDTDTDSFTYTITDGEFEDTGTVTVTVTGVPNIESNLPPVAVADLPVTDENTLIAFNVLDNDTDPDGDTITFVSSSPLIGDGVLTDNGGGSFTFDPDGQFEALNDGDTAVVGFTYDISDGNGGSDTGTVEITISGIADTIGPLFEFALLDTASDSVFAPITDGATINAAALDEALRSISADFIGDGVVGDDDGSIQFDLMGPDGLLLMTTESNPIFSLTGGDTDILDPSEPLVDGEYTLTVTAFSGNRATGELLAEETIGFTLHTTDTPSAEISIFDVRDKQDVDGFGIEDAILTDEALEDRNGDGNIAFGQNGVLDLDGSNANERVVDFDGAILPELGVRLVFEDPEDDVFVYMDARATDDQVQDLLETIEPEMFA